MTTNEKLAKRLSAWVNDRLFEPMDVILLHEFKSEFFIKARLYRGKLPTNKRALSKNYILDLNHGNAKFVIDSGDSTIMVAIKSDRR